MPEILSKRLGPFPAWLWIAAGLAGIVGYMVITHSGLFGPSSPIPALGSGASDSPANDSGGGLLGGAPPPDQPQAKAQLTLGSAANPATVSNIDTSNNVYAASSPISSSGSGIGWAYTGRLGPIPGGAGTITAPGPLYGGGSGYVAPARGSTTISAPAARQTPVAV